MNANGTTMEGFGWPDYAVFSLSLVSFAAVGVYSALAPSGNISGNGARGSENATDEAKEELIGDRKISLLPVTLSVMASFLSAISLLGFTSEIYVFGTMMLYYAPMYCIAFPLVAYTYLPVLFELKLTSIYKYLELRFGTAVRIITSIMFILQMILYMGVVLYAPALALASVTPLSVPTSILATGCLATFYTASGGARAVIYTSAIQMLLIFGTLVLVVIVGLVNAGGVGEVWRVATNGQRIQFDDFRFDPHVRHSFWSLFIGGSFMIAALFGTNQMTVQRYMAMLTLDEAKKILLLNVPFNVIIIILYTIVSLIIYATYQNPSITLCDPQKDGRIDNADQLLPYFVMDRLRHLHGLPGLFVAAVYSAGLSTLAGGLNALSAVVYEDFVKMLMRQRVSIGQHSKYVIRAIATLLGFITILLAFLFMLTRSMVLKLSMSIFGLFGGPVLGVFTLGIFVPFANAKGAQMGLLGATLVNLCIGFGAKIASVRDAKLPVLPVEGTCHTAAAGTLGAIGNYSVHLPEDYNMVLSDGGVESVMHSAYRISYQFYSLIGCLVCVLVGLLASLATGGASQAANVPQPLLSPMLRERFGRAVPPGYFDAPQRPTVEEMQMLNSNSGTNNDVNKC